MAAGHRLKIFSVTKEENMKHSIVCTCFQYLLSVTELSHFDGTDFSALNWLYFNLDSVFACWNNAKVHYVAGVSEEPDVSLFRLEVCRVTLQSGYVCS
jgi:hypothetical protein